MAGGLPSTRRRSNSSGGAAANTTTTSSSGNTAPDAANSTSSVDNNNATAATTTTTTTARTSPRTSLSSSSTAAVATATAAASRPTRRGRGLPTSTSASTSSTTATTAKNKDPAMASPLVVASSSSSPVPALATSSSSLSSVPRSSRASPRTSTSRSTTTAAAATAKPTCLVAHIIVAASAAGKNNNKHHHQEEEEESSSPSVKTMQVTLKVGGKVFVPSDHLADHHNQIMPTAPSLASSSLSRPTTRRQRSASVGNSVSTKQQQQQGIAAGAVKQEPEDPTSTGTSPSPQVVLPLGHDGNTFYCSGCGEVGDVVCCDGCPRVYHRDCVPAGVSKISLEQDDDPWFCPSCCVSNNNNNNNNNKKKKSSIQKSPTKKGGSPTTTATTKKEKEEVRTCFECNEKGVGLQQCLSCEGWIHFPSCHPDDDFDDYDDDDDDDEYDSDDDDSPRKRMPPPDPNRILCRICRVEELETATSPSVTSSPNKATSSSSRRHAPKSKHEEDDDDDDDDDGDDDEDNDEGEGVDDEDDDDDDDDDGMNSKAEEASNDEDEDEDEDEDGSKADDDSKADEESRASDSMDVDDASSAPPDGSPSTTNGNTKAKKPSKINNNKNKKKPKEIKKKKESGSKKASSTIKSQPALSVKKRSRQSLPSSKVKANMELEAEISSPATGSGTASSPTSSGSKKTKKDKTDPKKKNKKKTGDKSDGTEPKNSPSIRSVREDDDDADSVGSSHGFSTNGGYPKATPAFFYFLNENRLKIERHLARKHRIFNRLPKGFERNELVAKEGALWWTKLSDSEVRRYMVMSMKEFEQQIIEWKEEKNIRDMLLDDGDVDDVDNVDISLDDEALTFENHKRLYLGTLVGSKPFKPEPGTSRNRILLELLQDMRFHPMPMLTANRSEVEYGQMDFDRVTIPHFDVHGPFSTSVGDECLGCTRGWTHFCNVLKRRIPAIEHRAKLQPPLSSLVATRVGLGLRPRAPDVPTEAETEESAKNIPLFATRDIPESVTVKKLPMIAWESLSDPSSRADDIVTFIEETVAMKVPEPIRPNFSGQDDDSDKKGTWDRGVASLRRTAGQKRSYDTIGGTDDRDGHLNKCGRCRTVIATDTGCIPCRRAQLVINMSKRPAPLPEAGSVARPVKNAEKGESAETEEPSVKDNLKVQTVMCGRVTIKECLNSEAQNETDIAISSGILRQRWTPFTIMPPTTLSSPTPKSKLQHRPQDRRAEDGDDASMDEVLTPKNPEHDSNSELGDDNSVSSRSKEDSMDVDDDDSTTTAEPAAPDGTRPSSKRLRSARITAASQAEVQEDDQDRHELALRYKKEADELNKKCVGVACCGILLALMRRDPLLLFASPVTAEGYSAIVKQPIDFGKIRNNVLEDQYSTLGAFVSDCRLLCTNASAYNPPGSIYWKTAKELYDVLTVMQKRVSKWMSAIKDAHAMAWRKIPRNTRVPANKDDKNGGDDDRSTSPTPELLVEDPFLSLRKTWPEAVEMLEDSDWLRRCISADFMRTRENETAFYGALAVRRTAAAAESALAAYPDSTGIYNPVPRRTHAEDEALRRAIDERTAEITHPVELKDLPSWREDSIIRVLRRAQGRRLEGLSGSNTGCARCDGNPSDSDLKRAKLSQPSHLKTAKRKNNEVSRIHPSRISLSTGMASQSTRDRIHNIRLLAGELNNGTTDLNEKAKAANEVAVTVRGSGIHGWGMFADQSFKKGDVVAEYIGEYVTLAVTEAREKMYQEQRIQDYQFRLDDQLVIDATIHGGHGRYINHNCNPNCIAKVIPGLPPNEHLKRVIIIAQRAIEPREELTYDYQFPLELDLAARIPCNCMSEHCRGFMNWDLPEKGSNTQVFRSQKRGANMRDRIRRLGRPLKSDRGDDDDDDDE